ncbi:E3 ubiquitin-protein ligase SINA-like 1 [Apostasia shenzhenica]|uniref:E3 ubiquitin-protein ligase SINA-like 1 n=1 Tax=Apostasia shenzhenica TaxID=1088818 RepID=A0A2I0A154_9ASPA|nr:E3 ubiquitin-protein ligase SINA-like 1 [Apostasia shenzhenica]
MCRHAPLFCPVSDCTFAGSKQLLSDHIKSNHSKIVGNFSYNKCFKLTMKQQESYLVLLGDDDHVFLLLNDFEIGPGNALSVIGIIPNSVKFKFSCVFRVRSTGNVLSLRTSVEKMRKWSGIYPTNSFLIVPDYLSSYNGIHVDVCIGKSAGISM